MPVPPKATQEYQNSKKKKKKKKPSKTKKKPENISKIKTHMTLNHQARFINLTVTPLAHKCLQQSVTISPQQK
jgi:hypothetical protein